MDRFVNALIYKILCCILLLGLSAQCTMNPVGFGALTLKSRTGVEYEGWYEIGLGSDKTRARKLRVLFFAPNPKTKRQHNEVVIFDRTYLVHSDLGEVIRKSGRNEYQTVCQVKDKDDTVVFSCSYEVIDGNVTENRTPLVAR
jgi:hypothetical protein